MISQKNKAFTLVELIVVIVILAILATITFLSFNSYSSSARDSSRMADIANIVKGLGVFNTTSGNLPYPDNYITVNAGTGYNMYQGSIGLKVLGIIKMSDAKDNLDNTYYSYSTNKTRTSYSVGGYLENKLSYLNGIKETVVFNYNINNNVIPAQAGIFHISNYNNYLFSFFDIMKIPVSGTRMTNNLMANIGKLFDNNIIFNEIGEINALDYSKRYLYIKGGTVGILTESGSNSILPIEQTNSAGTTIDLLTTSKNLTLNTSSTTYSNGNNSISGSGLIVGIIQSNQNSTNGYSAPTSCPDGFIPVPGNHEFNQPGFCVAKYEMKQASGDVGSWNGTAGAEGPTGTAVNSYCTNTVPCNNTGGIATITTKGTIISKPDGYPIVWLNQYNAIEACKSMGAGYHLITNNEWMTIARDIEKQSSNWSGGIIGTTLSRGQSNGSFGDNSTGAMTAIQGEYGSPSSGFINKRTHNLSNGQVIWDLAGNVWEHVNKINTMDGGNYDKGTNGINFTSPKIDICNSTDGVYEWSTCNSLARVLYGPSNSLYTTTNGIGAVYDYDAVIFLRSGVWRNATAGIFTLNLNWSIILSDSGVGFRCTK